LELIDRIQHIANAWIWRSLRLTSAVARRFQRPNMINI